jgi:nucleotide-binding universal stress UspA family protein
MSRRANVPDRRDVSCIESATEDSEMYERVLVPIDGSNPSQLAIQEAIKLAKGGATQIQLFHVVDEHLVGPTFDPSYVSSAIYADAIAAFQAQGRRILDEAAALLRQANIEPRCTFIETIGRRPAELIVEAAREWPADLIIMGTHGRRGLRRLVMGSDAEWVLRSAPVPVLMVRGPEA